MDPEANQGPKAVAEVPTSRSAEPDEETSARQVDVAPATAGSARKRSSGTRPKSGTHPNNVRRLRQSAMMSKAELARRAGVSPLTIDRVEAGCPCRMDTKRKILEALGLPPLAAKEVFPDVDLG